MTNKIVEQLRDAAYVEKNALLCATVAADEIERLVHELDKASRLLSQFVGWQHDLEIIKAKQAQEIERLRHGPDFANSLRYEAADEIERLQTEIAGWKHASISALGRTPPFAECASRDENALEAKLAEAMRRLRLITDIAEGSTTANSLPHIAKIARGDDVTEGR